MMERLLDHWPQKLGALVLALVVWFFVSTSETTTTQRSLLVPLNVEGIGERRVAVGLPDVIEVTVTGPSNRIDRLRPENIEAVLDLTGLQGDFQQTIDVRPPQGIELEDVSPEQVIGFLESVTSKEVPVDVVWLRDAPEDTALSSRAEPSTIAVSARTEILARVQVVIAPVPAEAGEVETAVFAATEDGMPVRDVTLSPDSVTVTTRARELLERREISVVLEGSAMERITNASLVRDTVTIVGPPSTLDELESVVARVDPETVPDAAGRYTLPIRLELPPSTFVVDAPSASVTVVDPSLPE